MMKARMGAALLVAFLTVPAAAYAQDVTRGGEDDPPRVERLDRAERTATDAAAVDEGRAGPLATPPRFGTHALVPEFENRFAAADDAAVALPPTSTSKALMIAGAALLVSGLIIGDDAGTLVAVVGAGIGAYGVYLYFR